MPRATLDLALSRRFVPLRARLAARPLRTVAGLLVLVSLIFLAAPGLDLAVSGLFYDAVGGFFDDRSPVTRFVREAGQLAVWAVGIAFAAPLIVKLLAPESRLLVRPRSSLFALMALALGPGLIVNVILKEMWGRARPREIAEFGGDAIFSRAWWVSDQCVSNCSFVSGEAAAAFWLVALAFVAPKAWRVPVAVVMLAFAAAVSYARLAAGGHFISDVLIAWLLTLTVMVALQKLVLQDLPPEFDSAAETALTRGGRALRRWWVAFAAPRD